MTSLFLLTETWDESPSVAEPLRRDTAAKNAVVLPLDFWAGEKLRQASIPFERPRDHFDAAVGRDLDVLAAKLAQSWHVSLEDRLYHRGIPLGQMAEYDFTFLFIDALRSVDIARRLFEDRAPDRVFLSRPSFSRSPNAICHESLPGVVNYLARQRELPVTWSGPENTRRTPSTWRERTRDTILNGLVNSRTFFHSLRADRTVLFMRVSSHARIAAALHRLGLSSLSVPPTRRSLRKARSLARAFEPLWRDLQEDTAFRDALTYRDIPLSEVLEVRFRRFFREGLPALIASIEGADWLVRRLKPRMMVVAVDVSPAARALSRTLVRHGVPVLVVQHGAVSVDMGGFHVMPLDGDRQAVWGNLPREWHLQRGKAPESQVVTGNPGFDAMAAGRYAPSEEVRRRLGIDPEEHLILLATEWLSGTSSVVTVEDEEKFIRHTLRALKRFPDHQVVVKLHPGYQPEYEGLVRAIAEREGIAVTLANGDLWDLLAVSDVVIISNSTVGLEAMILGRPVVVVHAFEGMEEVPYVASGAALGAASQPEEIATAVEKALRDEGAREAMAQARDIFVLGYASEQDGLASKRVAQLIQEMVREPPS
jgi:hypothetical protein